MSTAMPMNMSCHDNDFMNTFSYLPYTEMSQIHPEQPSFLHEGLHQTDKYDLNSIPHLDLSPSFTQSPLSSPSHANSAHSCSFFSDCRQSDLRPLHHHQQQQQQQQQQQHQQQQQQQYIHQYPDQHCLYSSQESESCNEVAITTVRNNCTCLNISSKNIGGTQHKAGFSSRNDLNSDCMHLENCFTKDTNDNLSYDHDLDTVFDFLKKEEPFPGTSPSWHSVSDYGTDNAVSPQFHSTGLQPDGYDYQSLCVSAQNLNIKTEAENYPAYINEGMTFAEEAYHLYHSYGYGSYSTECASYPQLLPNGNYPVASYTAVKQSLDLQNLSTRHGSPISDEGFDEPNIPEEALPRFLNIHQYTDSDRDSHSGHSISSSLKEKRKIDGQLVPSHEKERRKPGRKPGQVSNVLHLWEFMRDLLKDVDGRGIIEWVSRQDGVFRVLNSSEVARLWGEKKKNKKQMTYEKLSRSLRYSRLEGYFADLPKDKNYPKKLCFKFGSKAKNWR